MLNRPLLAASLVPIFRQQYCSLCVMFPGAHYWGIECYQLGNCGFPFILYMICHFKCHKGLQFTAKSQTSFQSVSNILYLTSNIIISITGIRIFFNLKIKHSTFHSACQSMQIDVLTKSMHVSSKQPPLKIIIDYLKHTDDFLKWMLSICTYSLVWIYLLVFGLQYFQ